MWVARCGKCQDTGTYDNKKDRDREAAWHAKTYRHLVIVWDELEQEVKDERREWSAWFV